MMLLDADIVGGRGTRVGRARSSTVFSRLAWRWHMFKALMGFDVSACPRTSGSVTTSDASEQVQGSRATKGVTTAADQPRRCVSFSSCRRRLVAIVGRLSGWTDKVVDASSRKLRPARGTPSLSHTHAQLNARRHQRNLFFTCLGWAGTKSLKTSAAPEFIQYLPAGTPRRFAFLGPPPAADRCQSSLGRLSSSVKWASRLPSSHSFPRHSCRSCPPFRCHRRPLSLPGRDSLRVKKGPGFFAQEFSVPDLCGGFNALPVPRPHLRKRSLPSCLSTDNKKTSLLVAR